MWQLWTKGFTKETCQRIVEEGLKIPPRDAVIGFNGSTVDTQVRCSKVRWIDRSHPQLGWLFHEATKD